MEGQSVCILVEGELMGRIIPEAQKDGVRQRLLVFLEEPDFAVRLFSPNAARVLFLGH